MEKLMKLNFKLILTITFLSFFGCKEQKTTEKTAQAEIIIVDIGNTQNFEKLKSLHLERIYPNPLNSKSLSKSEKTIIINSWIELIDQLSDYMDKEKFDWETKDDVPVYQKVYFSENGEVEYYTFNVKNESITEEKKKEFADLLEKFSKTLKFDIKRNEKYWQCGTTLY
jgi:hypothetical protein